MTGSDGWWARTAHDAAALLAGGGRTGAGHGHFVDERWRRNNRALRERRGLPLDSRREVVLTFGAALLGLVLIAAAAIASAAIAPIATGQLVVLDEAGSVLDRTGPADQGDPPQATRTAWRP